jgi:translation initiation factor 5
LWLTPRADPTKFFGCELGAQTTFDEKADRYIVNGAHQADALRKLLDDFIAKFVLCGSCKNPETDLKIMKDGMILRDCKACGKRSDVDMRHKLTTFITKNPPPKKAKGAKGAGKAAGQSVEAQGGDDDDAKSDEDDFTAKINADAKDMPKANEAEDDADDVQWSVDTSDEAVKARAAAALASSLKANLVLGDDDEGEDDENSPYNQFGTWLLANRTGGSEGRTDLASAEVYKKAVELGIEKKHKAVQVLIQGLISEDAAKDVEKYGAVIVKVRVHETRLRVTCCSPAAQMTSSEKHQKSLLGGVERLAGVTYPELVPNGVPKVLMALYQLDALDEEVVQTWGTHGEWRVLTAQRCDR